MIHSGDVEATSITHIESRGWQCWPRVVCPPSPAGMRIGAEDWRTGALEDWTAWMSSSPGTGLRRRRSLADACTAYTLGQPAVVAAAGSNGCVDGSALPVGVGLSNHVIFAHTPSPSPEGKGEKKQSCSDHPHPHPHTHTHTHTHPHLFVLCVVKVLLRVLFRASIQLRASAKACARDYDDHAEFGRALLELVRHACTNAYVGSV